MRGAAASLLLFASCAQREPTVIDGSSPENFSRTVAEARSDLPDRDRLLFDRALKTVGGRWHGARDPEAHARVTFDGMTAREVVEDQRARETRGQQ